MFVYKASVSRSCRALMEGDAWEFLFEESHWVICISGVGDALFNLKIASKSSTASALPLKNPVSPIMPPYEWEEKIFLRRSSYGSIRNLENLSVKMWVIWFHMWAVYFLSLSLFHSHLYNNSPWMFSLSVSHCVFWGVFCLVFLFRFVFSNKTGVPNLQNDCVRNFHVWRLLKIKTGNKLK